MKKSILYIATITTVFCITLSNCSKKEDPAPSTTSGTTTSGTTTSGTTTSGTTTSGTTTSGTTTSGTTTSGTTTSGTTTSGTTTSGTETRREMGISGTFTIDGVSQTIVAKAVIKENSTDNITRIIFDSENYRFVVAIGSSTLQDGTYAIDDYGKTIFGGIGKGGGVYVSKMKPPYTQFWSVKGTGVNVVVSNKAISVNSISLTQPDDTTKTIMASCNITLN